MTADTLAATVGAAAAAELLAALDRIKHCVGQLSDEQIWWREQPALNSIGNLMLHLAGNVRQWLVSGLSGARDVRHRPAEFAERGPIPKDELLGRLTATVTEAVGILRGLSSQQLTETRRVQGRNITGLQVIFNSVPHFRGHTQEIIHLTRVQLGDAYQMAWTPTTPEQGAPS
ncbi:MAG TPA: DUF1572 family protein [Gemmataceae bacterium]|nr:DUF1572 family protein [Gemmataceae bacterium]